ncbi:Hint domain-containing protein [Paracoccus marinaquae]|uniref:Hint domain-containing protein n=1 Tax=Paracoccus marinaquae TaxID=2841926 RepID=A0ABS6AIV6_9RHOB|nr:Hint domain-containing protein [Paracoccus marinaquae]MBU3030530.1 Hint domain-containing protein [Paracoccus marinaquae]
MPDVTGGGTIDGVGVTTTTTYPEYATDTVEIRHEVSLAAQNNDDINIALAIDTSGSTADSSGTDLDGDGRVDTFLQAQVIAAKALFQTYIDNGYDPSRVTITLVEYGSQGRVVGVFNLDDQAAFDTALGTLRPNGATNYADPLSDIDRSWDDQNVDPNASNQVIFLSDGAQNAGGRYTDEAQRLADNFNANISGIGVGARSSLGDLNQLDNTGGEIGENNGAVQVTTIEDLINEINSPPPIVDVDGVRVTFTYDDPNNPGETITITRDYPVGHPALTPTASGYVLNTGAIDLEPAPTPPAEVTAEISTYFNNGDDLLSTGTITIPFYVCFTGLTCILTPQGEVMAGDLAVGDLVVTHDHGPKPILWIGKSKLSAAHLRGQSRMRPIRIRAGALGPHVPQRDLLVSPQHRVLVSSKIAERMFGEAEVLISAKKLLGWPGVEIAEDLNEVEYVHFIFDQHELVFSDGALSESLYTGPEVLKSLPAEQVEELLALFPEWGRQPAESNAIRTIPKGGRQKQLLRHHLKSGDALVSEQPH